MAFVFTGHRWSQSEADAGFISSTKRTVEPMAIPLLILFTESLNVGFAVRIEEFLAALLPRRFKFGRCDVPVRTAFFGNGTQVLAEIFHSGPP